MNIDVEKINNLSLDEIKVACKLFELWQIACKTEELIKKAYIFGPQEEEIKIEEDNADGVYEYITCQYVWRVKYKLVTIQVTCSAEEIFRYLKTSYFVNRSLVSYYDEEGKYSKAAEEALICSRFFDFVERTEKRVNN